MWLLIIRLNKTVSAGKIRLFMPLRNKTKKRKYEASVAIVVKVVGGASLKLKAETVAIEVAAVVL